MLGFWGERAEGRGEAEGSANVKSGAGSEVKVKSADFVFHRF